MNIYNGFETILVTLGLGNPVTRACVGGLLFSVPILFHSRFAYKEIDDGIFIPRNFAVTNPSDPEATFFPWWLIPLLGAALFGLFL